jgi:hypothetical protein
MDTLNPIDEFLRNSENASSDGVIKCIIAGERHGGLRTLPYDRFLIPLQTPTTRREGKGLLVKIFNPKVCHRHLLWHLIFRKIDVLEWLILFQNLKFQKNDGIMSRTDVNLTVLLILASATLRGPSVWNSTTKSLRKLLQSTKRQNEFEDFEQITLLDHILQNLKIPKKGMSKSNLYTVEEISIPKTSLPPELYVGVGYKDHGTMTSEEYSETPQVDSKYFDATPFVDRKFLRLILKKFQKSWNIDL